MGTADSSDLGRRNVPSSGVEKAGERKFSLPWAWAAGFAEFAKTFGKPASGGYAMSCQIKTRPVGRPSMSQSLIWLTAIAQGLGVLALNVALRVLVS
jgi:hypothetical protein